MMITHTFARTATDTLISAECSLAEFLDEAREMVSVGDLQPGLFAELSQIKAQIAVAVESRRPVNFNGGRRGRRA